MGDLTVGMDTRIGTAGTMSRDGVIEEIPKCVFEISLNRGNAKLNLPPVVVCAVVSQSQFDLAHADPASNYSTGIS